MGTEGYGGMPWRSDKPPLLLGSSWAWCWASTSVFIGWPMDYPRGQDLLPGGIRRGVPETSPPARLRDCFALMGPELELASWVTTRIRP